MMRTLAVLLAVLLQGAVHPEEQKGPRINVEPSSFDFGSVVAGSSVEKEFVVRNFGTEVLEIAAIVPSCGCTVVDRSYPKSLRPGAAGSFHLRLDLPRTSGHVVKSVLVKSNDPVKPAFEVKIEATVVDKAR
jgi:hypothetical protein